MTAGSDPVRQSPVSVVALSGGVGGAKLVCGLEALPDVDELVVIVNTGDDFEHLGLHISPDIDSILYALSGRSDPERGWGRAQESWSFMEALEELGGETWFQLGDRDLATHVERTRRLRNGQTLSEVTAAFTKQLGIRARIVPVSDDPIRTIVETPNGDLPFQNYFVREGCSPIAIGFRYDGAAEAKIQSAALRTLSSPSLQAVVLCPSNPFVSIDPILAVPGICQAIGAARAPVVCVSPFVGGQALKGPAAKMMSEQGAEVSPAAIVRHYGDLVDGLVADRRDETKNLGIPVRWTDTVMQTPRDKQHLAREVLEFALDLQAENRPA